ncbi:MAG: hypothetical protein VX923_03360 [Pseudomonadota bacterium]|nr:hypothetical protein [Pseudomonadota bacterium]
MWLNRVLCLIVFHILVVANLNKIGYVLAADISVDTEITIANTNTQQNIDTNGVTLTINANTTGRNNNGISVDSIGGATVIIGSGVTVSVNNNQAIDGTDSTNLTVINSGTISAVNKTIELEGASSGATITNKFGGTITSQNNTIKSVNTASKITINNYGQIEVTGTGHAIAPVTGNDSYMVINNLSTGVIVKTSTADAAQETIELGTAGTLINSGQIRNDTSPSNNAINLKGDNSTLLLKDGGIVVGRIVSNGTGNKLQLSHGFGKAYFYETVGDLSLEDLSGNVVVKGSAGSVGLGAQETVDELLGVRVSNLRAMLSRYMTNFKVDGSGKSWIETFGYKTEREESLNLLEYDTTSWGVNFVQPLSTDVKFLTTIEFSELSIQGDHEIDKKGFLMGISYTKKPFSSISKLSTEGFILGGVSHNQSNRKILTNTTTSGVMDLDANYYSYESIAGGNLTYSIDLDANDKSQTELGFTLSSSHIGDYNEGNIFFWEDRSLVQESIYLREQISHRLNEKISVNLGAEIEHRKVLEGKQQEYKIKKSQVKFSGGNHSEVSISGNLDLQYKIPNGLAFAHIQHQISDSRQKNIGGGVGVNFSF